MNATLASGASLRQITEIVRNAVLFGSDAWKGGSPPQKSVHPSQLQHVFPADRDVVGLFTLPQDPQIPYLLVGVIAMLRGVAAPCRVRPELVVTHAGPLPSAGRSSHRRLRAGGLKGFARL